jgi:hypothetical protein
MPSVYIGVGFTASRESFKAQERRLGYEIKHTKIPGTDLVSTQSVPTHSVLQDLCDEFLLPKLSAVHNSSDKKREVAFFSEVLLQTSVGEVVSPDTLYKVWVPAFSPGENLERLRASFGESASNIGLVVVHGEDLHISGVKPITRRKKKHDRAAVRKHDIGCEKSTTGALGPCPVDRSADLSLP